MSSKLAKLKFNALFFRKSLECDLLTLSNRIPKLWDYNYGYTTDARRIF